MLRICKKEEQGTNVDVSIAITKKKERQSDYLDVLHTFFDKKSRSEDFQKKMCAYSQHIIQKAGFWR